ncbi:MAG: hypothetical protein L0177_11870 [Chloroflexi bacterium]|nr:hypothetical protein [Chloroflexota bacterium]
MGEVNITAQDMAQLIKSDPVVRLKAENIALRRRIAELEGEAARQLVSTGSPQVPLSEEGCGDGSAPLTTGAAESIGVPEKDCT